MGGVFCLWESLGGMILSALQERCAIALHL
jgi:hypothetical protein